MLSSSPARVLEQQPVEAGADPLLQVRPPRRPRCRSCHSSAQAAAWRASSAASRGRPPPGMPRRGLLAGSSAVSAVSTPTNFDELVASRSRTSEGDDLARGQALRACRMRRVRTFGRLPVRSVEATAPSILLVVGAERDVDGRAPRRPLAAGLDDSSGARPVDQSVTVGRPAPAGRQLQRTAADVGRSRGRPARRRRGRWPGRRGGPRQRRPQQPAAQEQGLAEVGDRAARGSCRRMSRPDADGQRRPGRDRGDRLPRALGISGSRLRRSTDRRRRHRRTGVYSGQPVFSPVAT